MLRNWKNFKTRLGANGVLLVGFDNKEKSVNILNKEVLGEFGAITLLAIKDSSVRAIVIFSLKNSPPSFIAGADIGQIKQIISEDECRKFVRSVHGLFDAMDRSKKPIVAAIEGSCLGGGLELALACHWRVASDHPQTVFALPEVMLGIIPGFGGTQRLPKLIGLPPALEMITSGKNIYPYKALKSGLIDDLVGYAPADERSIDTIEKEVFVSVAVQRALELANSKRPLRKIALVNRIAGWPVARKYVFSKAGKLAREKTGGFYPAPLSAIDAVEEGFGKPVNRACLESEMPRLSKLVISPISKNLIDIFFSTEALRQAKTKVRPSGRLKTIGVAGAGLMGSQIAANLSEKGFNVLLKDLKPEFLANSLKKIAESEAKDLSRRVITKTEYEQRLLRIYPTLNWESFRNADLVVEAIKEVLAWKQELLSQFESIARPDAVFATNTSSFMVSEIAQNAKHKERCIAMHFFNPLRAMKLVEIGAADFTSSETVAQAVNLAKRMGKLPLIVKDCPGFLVNRILSRYLLESIHLLAEGVPISDIDRAAKNFGMAIDSGRAMGPLELIDYIGVETCFHVIESLKKLGDRIKSQPFVADMVSGEGKALGFWKNGKENPALYRLLKDKHGWTKKTVPEKEITEKLISPMVDEALRCLSEGIVDDPNKIDLAMLYGAGFPAFRGGLLKWAKDRKITI